MSRRDDKTTEKEGKLRLADGSADAVVPSPPPALIEYIQRNDEKKTFRGDDGLVPGAFAVGHTAPSRGEEILVDGDKQNQQQDSSPSINQVAGKTTNLTSERTKRSNEKFKNLRRHDHRVTLATESSDVVRQDDSRSKRNRGRNEKFKNLRSHDDHRVAPATESSDVAHQDDGDKLVETNLVEAEIAQDVDVEALVNERIQQITAGVAEPVEVNTEEDEEQEEGNRGQKFRNLPLIILVGVVVVVGGAVGGTALTRSPAESTTNALTRFPTEAPTPVPTSPSRAATVGAILADLAPWNEKAITWLTETDTWEPEDGDPNSDYLWRERYVMADLYYNTRGPVWWLRDDGWLSAEPVCNWYFYEGAANECPGPIKELRLGGNEMMGSIPSSVGSLTQLTALSLNANQLTGSIPSSIGSLTQLIVLSLWGNQLTGSIPSSVESLTQLTALSLYENQLTGSIPSSIRSLTQLTYLNLLGNQLIGSIPSSIGSLTQLTALSLWGNQLTGSIPSSVESLTQLTALSLGENQFTGSIPSFIGSLPELRALDLYANQLIGSIPSSIGSLTQLIALFLHSNRLIGSIPSSVGSLTELTALYLHANQLTGSIPSSIGSLTQLTALRLNKNQLTGSIPSIIGSLTQLTYLYLEINRLSGTIPALPSSVAACWLHENCFHDTSNGEAAGCIVSNVIYANPDSIPTPARCRSFDRPSVDGKAALYYEWYLSAEQGMTAPAIDNRNNGAPPAAAENEVDEVNHAVNGGKAEGKVATNVDSYTRGESDKSPVEDN